MLAVIALRALRRRLARFGVDRRGSAMVEFALGLPVLMMVLVGVFEVCMLVFANVLLEGGVRAAARYGITGREVGGASREEQIANIIAEESLGLLDVRITGIETFVYDSFDEIGSGEEYVDANGNGEWDPGETFTDANGNGIYDAEPGTPGAGDGSQVVLYNVSGEWQTFTPFIGHVMGNNGSVPLRASVAVQNEPFDTDDTVVN
jgi:Flp pilus assembly protein TadG